jgi:predicted DNA-binding protein (MmcQ/YjbR family)
VRELCLSLPGVEEKISHGEPTFFVKKRTFVMFADNHHGDGRRAIWCNTSDGAQDVLIGSDPDNFFSPPYVGCRGWIGVRLDRDLAWGAIAAVVKDAYAATVAKAVRRKRAP